MNKYMLAVVLLSAFGSALGGTYSVTSTIVGSDFYDAFTFEAISDPTNGRVNYVSEGTARSKNLTFASRDTFILRCDAKTVLNPHGPGRNSVRIRSNDGYRTHVAVFKIRHMPQGCGTWPAVWEVGDNWPYGGEVDIVEGVNDRGPNLVSMHTGPGCSMPRNRWQTGKAVNLDCNAGTNSNSGCGVSLNTGLSYGPSFNRNGGGWYAIERTSSGIVVWFWAANDHRVPKDVSKGASRVNTGHWGTPSANFPNTQCNINSHFSTHHIIINLTLCGDWAGNVYPDTCPQSCVDHVNNKPSAFRDAYFDFASIRIYQ